MYLNILTGLNNSNSIRYRTYNMAASYNTYKFLNPVIYTSELKKALLTQSSVILLSFSSVTNVKFY